MSPETEKLLEAALKLPPEARAALAGHLIDSLDDEIDPDAESLWEAEIANRIGEIESNAVTTIPWSDARRRILTGQ